MIQKGDVTLLLKKIRNIGLQVEFSTSLYNAINEANALYHACMHEEGEINAKHLRNFKSIVSVVEHLGGSMFADDVIIDLEREKDTKKGNDKKDDQEYKKL